MDRQQIEAKLAGHEWLIEKAWRLCKYRWPVFARRQDDFFQDCYVILLRCFRCHTADKGEFAGYAWTALMNRLPELADSYKMIQVSPYFRRKAKTDPEVARAVRRIDQAEVFAL